MKSNIILALAAVAAVLAIGTTLHSEVSFAKQPMHVACYPAAPLLMKNGVYQSLLEFDTTDVVSLKDDVDTVLGNGQRLKVHGLSCFEIARPTTPTRAQPAQSTIDGDAGPGDATKGK